VPTVDGMFIEGVHGATRGFTLRPLGRLPDGGRRPVSASRGVAEADNQVTALTGVKVDAGPCPTKLLCCFGREINTAVTDYNQRFTGPALLELRRVHGTPRKS